MKDQRLLPGWDAAALRSPIPGSRMGVLGRSIHVRGKGCAHDMTT